MLWVVSSRRPCDLAQDGLITCIGMCYELEFIITYINKNDGQNEMISAGFRTCRGGKIRTRKGCKRLGIIPHGSTA